jgi:hypothetical protein
MKLPKRSQTYIFKNYTKYAIELYGPRFVFTEFDRFFANLRKCAISTCTNDKFRPNWAICHQHNNIYMRNKNKSDTLKDPEKIKLFVEAKAHFDSVKAKFAEKKAVVEKRRAENGESNECKIASCKKDKMPSGDLCSSHLNAENYYKNNLCDKNKKFLDEYLAYLEQKKEAEKERKAAILANGPNCSECGETDTKKFKKKSTNITGYEKLCNKCFTAKYCVCHKHSEPEKTHYKTSCIYCKLDDGKQPSQLCHDNEFCITQINRGHATYGLSCAECFARKNPDHPQVRYLRDKEQIFHAFLKSILPNTEIKHDVPVHVTLPNGKKTVRRPDFRIEMEQVIFDIEFDEHQHTAINYDTPCEQMRSDLIFQAIESSGKKYVLLRFNPDAFTAKNGDKFRACFTQKSCANAQIADKAEWDIRTSYFKFRLDEWMQADPENLDIFNVEYLFYNDFDTFKIDSALHGGSSSAKRRRIT